MDYNYKYKEFFDRMPQLKPREMVECRFYGDRKWYIARVTKVYPSGLADLRLEDGSQEHQVERHMIRKSTDGEYLDSNFDAGMYEPRDPVEVKLAGAPWQSANVILSNNDGTYTIQTGSSEREDGVAGRWLRHYFQRDQVVEARPYGQTEYREAVILDQDTNGYYSIRFLDGQMESTVNPRRMFPNDRRFIYVNALNYIMDRLGYGSTNTFSQGNVFQMGDRVECRARDGSTWYAGRISQVYGNNTYDVSYLDGVTEFKIAGSYLRLASPGSGGRNGRGASRFVSPKKQTGFLEDSQVNRAISRSNSNSFRGKFNFNSNTSPRSADEGLRAFGFYHGDAYDRSFQEGMRVEARYHGHGTFCPGYIHRVNADGTYDVSFDYNEVFPGLLPEAIRPFNNYSSFYGAMSMMNDFYRNSSREPHGFIEPSSYAPYDSQHGHSDFGGHGPRSQHTLRKGLRVEIQSSVSGGKWRGGRILRMSPQGTYDVTLDNGATETNIPLQNIRYQFVSGRFGEDSNSFGGSFLYRPDMPVEARMRGSSRYYPGFIHGCHPDGTYDVCFDDGTTEMGIKQNMIRPYGYEEHFNGYRNSGQRFSGNSSSKFYQSNGSRYGPHNHPDYERSHEYCSGYYGSLVSDGYGFDSMCRNSEREFRGHPNYFNAVPTETGFGVYHPREVFPDRWNPMCTYIYDAFREYFFRYQFQSKNPGLDSRHNLNRDGQLFNTPGYLPPGTEITIVPSSEWCEFSGGEPTIGRVVWNGWRVSCPFFFKPRPGTPRNFTMKVVFFARAVIVCEVTLDMYYAQGVDDESLFSRGSNAYRGRGANRFPQDAFDRLTYNEEKESDLATSPGRGRREEFNRKGASNMYVDVRCAMFRNIYMIQMENDEGYEMLMAETIEAVPGISIHRADSNPRSVAMYVQKSDRVQFLCSRDGGFISSDANSDYRAVQAVLTAPEERAHKMLLTFSDLPMVFPQSMDRLPGCNSCFNPEVNIYRWQYQASGRPQIQLRQRLYEAARTISRSFFEISDRPVPLGMLLLPTGGNFYSAAGFSKVSGEGYDVESSSWNLFFMCEDHASQTMRDEFVHQPIEMRFDPQFFVEAYPLLKATVAVLMYCRLTYKDNLPCFPTPFNAYGLSKRFDENMLVDMSNFYDDQALKLSSSGFGNREFGIQFGGRNTYRMGGQYDDSNNFNRNTSSRFSRGGGPNNPYSTPMASKSFTLDPVYNPSGGSGGLFGSSSMPNLPSMGQTLVRPNSFGGYQNYSMYGSDGRFGSNNQFGKLNPGNDFLVNAVECSESALALVQNWALWRSARKVRSRLDEVATTWLQQCDMRPLEIDLKVWWVSGLAYEERWKYMHWMISGPDAPTFVSPGPGGLGVLPTPTPTAGFSTLSNSQLPMMDITSHLTGEVGIKDFSVANEIAMRLNHEGFEMWEDVLHMDEYIGIRNNFDEVKWFLCDLGIPTIYASKIMGIIRSHQNMRGSSQ